MTYDQLLPVYRQATGLPGQDAAFNQWVQGIIDATGSNSVESIPENFFSTPTGQQYVAQSTTTPQTQQPAAPQTPATQPAASSSTLAELRLDPDFAALPANWQTEIAQMVDSQGLAAASAEMARRAVVEGQDPSFAGARSALGRWAQKGSQNAANVSSPGTNLPLEQDLLNQILPGLLGDIGNDAQRQELVNRLVGQLVGNFDASWAGLSPEESARRLLEEYGHADQTTNSLVASSQQAAQEQLAALQASIAAMQGNLTGELAAKAASLQQLITSLNSNLDTLDATQKATLAQQIASTQQNLEDSIAAQRQSLQDEIASLRTAADTYSQSRAAALQKEVDSLTAAQAPMAKARLDSAQALASAVNLGLEGTKDQLTANRAKQGYLGGSTFDNAALARASVGARQQAAQALGQAREANAGDIRSIMAHGATEGRSLQDELANNLLGLDTRSATGQRTLADLLATGTQGIRDTGAAGLATIQNNTATGRYNIGTNAAGQQFQDQTLGAAQARELADALARGGGDIATVAAQQQQQARDQGTTARQNYFDNAYTRSQGGLLARNQLASQLAGALGNIEGYGTSGANRALNTLNWWSSSAQAPTSGYVPVTASNTGNDIAGLGAGLLGSALNIGNANNWWQAPKASTIKGIPVVNTPSTASGSNWWNSAPL